MAKRDYRDDYRPVGPRGLAVAIVAQGLEDAKRGCRDARAWLHSPEFDAWCAWVDLNPDYLRRKVAPLIPAEPPPKRPPAGGKGRAGTGRVFTAEEIAEAVRLRDETGTWTAAARALHTNSTTLREALNAAGISTGKQLRPTAERWRVRAGR